MSNANTWKLQDAKARFSEVVRRPRAGEPQEAIVHGRKAVVIVDAERFDVQPKAPVMTMAEFIEGSKKYRGAAEGIDFEPRLAMSIKPHPIFFDDDDT